MCSRPVGASARDGHLARNSPDARITSVDVAGVAGPGQRQRGGGRHERAVQRDILRPPCAGAFDHVFICFVLEHLARPLDALAALKTVLRPGGTITAIEGDHGSAYFHPDSKAAHDAIRCLVDLQRAAGGNALIGRELYPLLTAGGFHGVRVSPRMVYVDSSKPELVEGFTKRTFTAMIEGVREPALEAGMLDAAVFDGGIRDLYATAGPNGVFCYTFFKGVAVR